MRLGLPKGLFPVGLPVKILKALLPSSIRATRPAHLNLLDLITLVNSTNYEVPRCGALSSYWLLKENSALSFVPSNYSRPLEICNVLYIIL